MPRTATEVRGIVFLEGVWPLAFGLWSLVFGLWSLALGIGSLNKPDDVEPSRIQVATQAQRPKSKDLSPKTNLQSSLLLLLPVLFIQPGLQWSEVVDDRRCIHLVFAGHRFQRVWPRFA